MLRYKYNSRKVDGTLAGITQLSAGSHKHVDMQSKSQFNTLGVDECARDNVDLICKKLEEHQKIFVEKKVDLS